jgi:bilin biosynthesis protein
MALATFNSKDSELLKKMVECMGDSQGMVRLSLAETLDSIGKPATFFAGSSSTSPQAYRA